MVIDQISTWFTTTQYDRPFRETRTRQLEIQIRSNQPSNVTYTVHVYRRLPYHFRVVVIGSGPGMKIFDLHDKFMDFVLQVAQHEQHFRETFDEY